MTKRPSWAVDGSFLCFRKLKQNVPEFRSFLKETGDGNPELLGARLVGRWESGMCRFFGTLIMSAVLIWLSFVGAPVDIQDKEDNVELANDPSRNDDFRYDQKVQQQKCPYTAHTRKTNPRDDFPRGGTEKNRILRRGIQYGPEVTDEEETSGTSSNDPSLERGLLFVCYQSNLANGFPFIQKCKYLGLDTSPELANIL